MIFLSCVRRAYVELIHKKIGANVVVSLSKTQKVSHFVKPLLPWVITLYRGRQKGRKHKIEATHDIDPSVKKVIKQAGEHALC